MQKPIKIFCCHAYKDQPLYILLRKHLAPLLQKQPILLADDINVHPGTDWKKELKEHLEQANIILLLISPDFMTQDYGFSDEIKQALDLYERGEVRIIPILLRSVDLPTTPFAHLQALPRNGRFLTTASNQDMAFADIAREIRSVTEDLIVQQTTSNSHTDRAFTKYPHNLPRLPEFLGREKDVSYVFKALSSRYPIISIEGFPGVGKTMLAIKTAYESLERGLFERIVWVSAENRPEQKQWLTEVLNTVEKILIPVVLNHSTVTKVLLEDKLLAVDQLLRTYQTLVIIDNYETIHDPDLKTWIEDIPEPSKVLITSRASDWRKITSITLQGLENSEALELIRSHCSRRGLPQLATALQEKLLPLVNVTQGNPQAIIMVLGHIEVGKLSLNEAIEDLRLGKSTVDDIFDYLFEESWGLIRNETQDVLMVVPFFANSMSQQALAAAAGLSSFHVKAAAEQLTRLMLFEIQDIFDDQSYNVHPLTRAFAQTQLDSKKNYEQEARVRWSEYYVKFTRKNLLRQQQEDRYWNTLVSSGEATEIDREWFNLLNVLEWADDTKQYQVLIDLVLLLAHYMNRYFHYTERLHYAYKAALAAEVLEDWQCAALLRIDTLGWTLIEKKRLEEAEQEIIMGLSIAQTLDASNPSTIDLVALAHIFLARVCLEKGLLEKAESSIDQANALNSKSVVQFRAALVAGDIAYKKKEWQKAIQLYNQAHSISLKYGQEGEDEDLAYRLGMAYLATKDPIQAEQSFKNLPNIPEQYSGVTTGIIYIKLGGAYVARINNNYEEARRLAQEALSYLALGSDESHWMHDEIQRFLEEESKEN